MNIQHRNHQLRKLFTIHVLPFTFLLLAFGTGEVMAQRASLQGLVTDHATGQPLYGANIVLESTDNESRRLGASANLDGFYRISTIEPGEYQVQISFIGYTMYEDTLVFEPGEVKNVNMALEQDDAHLGEVTIAGGTGATRRIEGAQRITSVDMRRVPGPATGDLASYIQSLPGVVVMGDRGGQVFIRGGSPSENLVLVDGAIIYQPVHIVGFYSPFPESLVSGVDFYAGGFSPRYSGRLSSVMDIQMRHGDRFSFSGSGAISPFAAEVVAEGPIQKGSTSWMLSAKESLIEPFSTWYPIEEQPLKFQSQFLKTSYIDENVRCAGMLMHTLDRGRMDFDEEEAIRWRNVVLGTRCIALPEASRALVDAGLSVSRFSNATEHTQPFGFTSSITKINLDLNLRQYIGEIRFDYGLYSQLKYLNYDLGERFVGFTRSEFSLFGVGAYLETSIPLGKRLDVQPGFAVSAYPAINKANFEPRFRFSWQPFGSDSEELFGSAGLYKQAITGISDMRDISSVFVAWMIPPIEDRQMQALHFTLGWQQSLAAGVTWSAEAYHKRMKYLTVPVWDNIARFNADLALADGEIYGSDIRFEYNRGRFYGMVGYGYSWTMYESAQDHFGAWFGEPIQEYHPPQDRRHQINTLFSVDIGSITTAIRWQLGTGMPFTRPMGFDDVLDFRERLPFVNWDRGTRRVILDKPYQGRLPTFHRLDFSMERTFRITTVSDLNIQIGAINLYNHTNLFYYDVYTHKRIDQLAFIPYVTLKIDFN